MTSASDKVLYRLYDPTLNIQDVEALFDVDELYGDIAMTLSKLSGTTLLITGWLILPWIRITSENRLQDLLVAELRKIDSKILILWNTNYCGAPYPELKSIAYSLHTDVIKSSGAEAERFKIILSTNRQFDLPGIAWSRFDISVRGKWLHDRAKHLINRTDPDKNLPPDLLKAVSDLWLKSFPGNAESFKNLSAFTLGSHHQKTVTITGTTGMGKKIIRAYCGGIDFAPGPSGFQKEKRLFHGSAWWHDSAMRVCGTNAVPVLKNFVERWNDDLTTFIEKKTLAFGVTAEDQLDVATLTHNVDMATAASGKVVSQRTMPLGGVDWAGGRDRIVETREAYFTWIGNSRSHIFLVNQYFRYKPLMDRLTEQLDDEPNLHLTLVFPMYTEEIGHREDLVSLRSRYAVANATDRPEMWKKIQNSAMTIDPINKLTLYAQSRALEDLILHPRVSIWMPRSPRGIPYVHSKMALFDKEALLIGSANINGRSLLGLADSEISLLLTDATEVTRIRDAQKWHIEPLSEKAPDYRGTWYAKHNLVRYYVDHWTVDNEFGRFPKGRSNFHDYVRKMQFSGRIDTKRLHIDYKNMDAAFDILGVGSDTDLGKLFLNSCEHLL
jgi:phosphatidylserine/phosphatidylglycerophosphate/cardiolipin synthase-like enzyme